MMTKVSNTSQRQQPVVRVVKLFVDDIRNPPDDTWVIARTANEALDLLKSNRYQVLSLDHDLGDDVAGTGYTVAAWLEEQAFFGRWNVVPDQILVHSANPAGVKNILAAVASIDRLRGKIASVKGMRP